MASLVKPRIIILSAFLSPFRSGAEACAEEVALRLCDQFDITIVTARLRKDLPRRDMLRGNVPVIRVGFGLPIDKWLFPFLAPIHIWMLKRGASTSFVGARGHAPLLHFAQHDVVIIHAILETFAGLALHFCRYLIPSAKRMLTLQTTNRDFMKGFIICSADKVTAISSVLTKMATDLGATDVSLIPNGIDFDRVLHREKEHGRVLFVGRLEPMKGVDILLRAFAKVKGDGVHLRIVGDGSKKNELEALTRELSLESRVTFVGYVPVEHVYEEFAKAEIFCGLSRSEALGNVFLEAQAEGCAVIGTNVGGIPDSVEHGVTGLLVPPNDVVAATQAMQKLIDDPILRGRLSENGKEHSEKYDWRYIAEQYTLCYKSVGLIAPVE